MSTQQVQSKGDDMGPKNDLIDRLQVDIQTAEHESEALGARLKRLRESRNLSVVKLATMAEITPRRLQRMEDGDTDSSSVDSSQKLAKALGVSIEYLLCREHQTLTDVKPHRRGEKNPTLFSKRLFELRNSYGLTQTELAKAVGVAPSTIQQLESGMIQMTTFETGLKLARQLQVDPEYLAGLKDELNMEPVVAADSGMERMFKRLGPRLEALVDRRLEQRLEQNDAVNL